MSRSKEYLITVLVFLINCELSVSSEPNQPQDESSRSVDNLKPNFENNFPEFTPFGRSDDAKNETLSSDGLTKSDREHFREKLKPLKNLVFGMYKNYRSTYTGNRTAVDYMKELRANMTVANIEEPKNLETTETVKSDLSTEPNIENPVKTKKQKKKRKKKKTPPLPVSYDGTLRYNVGTGVNVSLDMEKSIVNVNLDEDCLKEILTSKWDDITQQGRGRGKKNHMIHKILPLFILPFLIQSAIIPFLVSSLKLLLIKSIMVGKVAIFLLILSAFKNQQKANSYEPVPAYYVDHPSRRSETLSGYRVEGKPTSWVS